jgi:hypothetical protein
MPPHVAITRRTRSLARGFLPSRLAPAALAQVYELLFPGAKRRAPLLRSSLASTPPRRQAARA